MNQPVYIPTAREKSRDGNKTRRVYDILGDIKRLQAEQDRLLAKLVTLTN
jgi:hypothetical protein